MLGKTLVQGFVAALIVGSGAMVYASVWTPVRAGEVMEDSMPAAIATGGNENETDED
ncbi:MAG: hypothetical protein HQL33_03265 [Alphaproteobacteria bacterium]|nr:hypothetical protein [Alphaproteobacteria bacterium]MBF0128991.1 hypothetical protein [Alphaproteobacteria bacterium]